MDDLVTDDDPCEQCGLCCRIFGPVIAPTVSNVYVWMEQERTDILRWFVAFMEKSTPVHCAFLKPEDLSSVVSFEMRHPDTGEYVTVCPFLRRVAKERYLCGIHSVRTGNVLYLPAVDLGRDVFQPVPESPEKPGSPVAALIPGHLPTGQAGTDTFRFTG